MRKEHFTCPSATACPLGAACRDIHIDPDHATRVTSNPIHRHPPDGDCPRHPVGKTVDVFDHKSRQSTTVKSGIVLVTAGSVDYLAKAESGDVPPRMQQCTHFQRKHCLRGPECGFLHVLMYTPPIGTGGGSKGAPMQQHKHVARSPPGLLCPTQQQPHPVFSQPSQILSSHLASEFGLLLSAPGRQSRSGSGVSVDTSPGRSILRVAAFNNMSPRLNVSATMQYTPQQHPQQQIVDRVPQVAPTMQQPLTMMASPQMVPMTMHQQHPSLQQQQPMFVYVMQPPQTKPFGQGLFVF